MSRAPIRTRRRLRKLARAGVLLVAICLAGTVSAANAGASATAAAGTTASSGEPACPWLNQQLPVATRVSELLSAMTLDQKIAEMHASATTTSGPYAGYEGYVPAVPELCIPAIIEQDDSQGVAAGATGVTQLPATVALGSTWSPQLAKQYGAVNGEEHWAKGIDMALGPGVNIQRDPRWGRDYEMFSEDPYLSASLGASDTVGLQSQHVMANIKHFLTYNQETNRNKPSDDTVVSTRALEEIYEPPLYASMVGAGAASVMCSYASYNHQFSCESPYLLTQVIQNEWGYQGFIRSDGGGNHSTAASVNAGMDQEKGSDLLDNGLLADAVADGQVSEAVINRAVTKIFTPMFQMGLFNHPPTGTLADTVTTPAHAAFARDVAEQGTVLLKNDGPLLPLAQDSSVAVIGADGTTNPLTTGGGSPAVIPPYQVSPLAGIQSLAASGAAVTSYSGSDPAQAAAIASGAKVAVVFADSFETEGSDLPDINLPDNQDALIEAVAAANPNTIVVLNTGGPVLMPWLGQVKSVLEAWYPGQEDGNAIASILYGKTNPSGHLPQTFPTSLTQMPTSSPEQWPGANGEVQYSEGIDVGYRWYDQNEVSPLFPFGYGLSYTTFKFSHLSINQNVSSSQGTVQVSAQVTNTGTRTGSEVAQLYLGDPPAANEPPRQLEGFQKVTLDPGESEQVHFTLDEQNLRYYDSTAGAWAVAPGTYQVYVGDSSATADLPLTGSFSVNASTGARAVSVSAPADAQSGRPFTVTETLTAGGNLDLTSARFALDAPSGWLIRPTTPTATAQLPASTRLTATWQVTAPVGAQNDITQLAATAHYSSPGGTSTKSTYAQVTVDSLVRTTPSATSLLLSPGKGTPLTLTSTNTSPYPVSLRWAAQPPSDSGVSVMPGSGTATLAPGASTTISVELTGSTPSSALIPFTVNATGNGTTVAAAGAYVHTTTAFPNGLADAFNNTGITDDSAPTAGDLDGTGDTYSAQALAALGITPGGAVTANGITFTWPNVAAGSPDNVIAHAQTVPVSGSGSTLAVLGTGVNGAFSGTGTVYYTDGSTQSFTIGFANWTNGTPPAGDVLVAKTAYLNTPTGQLARARYLSAAFASLDPDKTVQAVQLPSAGTGATGMHIFAVAVG